MSPALRAGLLVAAISTLAALAGFLAGRPQTPLETSLPPAAPSAETTARLLALELPDESGQRFSLAQWRGKVLVLNFWATWCPPCKEEMSEFSRISREFAENGVQFVGISIDSADNVAKFRKEEEIAYPLLIGDGNALALSEDFGNRAKALPFTIVLRANGTAYRTKLGIFASEDLRTTLAGAARTE